MKPSTILNSCVLALTLAVPARAEDPLVVLSGGLLLNQGSTIDLTQKRTGGYNLEAGVLFSPEGFGPKILLYAGLLHIPAADPAPRGSTFTMHSPHFGADLVYRPWDSLPLTLSTGPSFHIWQVQATGNSVIESMDDKRIKSGWRAGVGYELGRHWSIALNYTFTEWRSDPNQGLASDNPSRPAYASLMGSYRF